MVDYSLNIDKWVNQAKELCETFPQAFAQNLIAEIKARTPVETGRLRASFGIVEATPDEITIGTNVVYARRIEYGFVGRDSLGRQYHQTGKGMVTDTLAHADEIAQRTIAQLQAGEPAPISGGIIGAAEGAAEGFLLGGPAGAATGAVFGAELGAAEGMVEGGKGTVAEGGAFGVVEGAVIGAKSGPGGAVIGGLIGLVEGAGEAKALQQDTGKEAPKESFMHRFWKGLFGI